MERCLNCRMWKPVWKWLEEVDRLTGRRLRIGALCRACSECGDVVALLPRHNEVPDGMPAR
jgi:hypothetical protein